MKTIDESITLVFNTIPRSLDKTPDGDIQNRAS
jgi:hypothetical protein